MSRTDRTDKVTFSSKKDAIEFGKKKGLTGYNLYTKDGLYCVKKYTKIIGEITVGTFLYNDGELQYSDYATPIVKKEILKERYSNDNIKAGYKKVDGDKLRIYITENGIDKRYLCNTVHKSRSFINDVIRRGQVHILCMDKICEELNLPMDYFDKIEEETVPEEPEVDEETTEEEIKEFRSEQIHDDLIALIASNRRLEVLMQEMIEMRKND